MLTEIDHEEKVEARISPSSMDHIWAWVVKEIASKDQKERLQGCCNGLEDEEITKRALAFKAAAMPSIIQILNKTKREIGGEQRLGSKMGGLSVYHDLVEIASAEQVMAGLRPVLLRMPKEVTSWSSPDGAEAYAAIERYIQQAPLKASWLFSALTTRLSSPRLKIQLATKLAGSDDTVHVAATVYAPAVIQTLADMTARLTAFEANLKPQSQIHQAVEHLTMWHSMARAMETELEIPVQSPWGKSLANMKTKLSDLLEREIEAAPRLMRQTLRAPKTDGIERVDKDAILESQCAVMLFHHAERMKDTIALNGPVMRIRKEIDQSFEILTTSLIDRCRKASKNDADTFRQLGEAAANYAEFLFDEDYANAFRRQLKAASPILDFHVSEAS